MPINKTEQMALESVQRQATKFVKGLKDKDYRSQLGDVNHSLGAILHWGLLSHGKGSM